MARRDRYTQGEFCFAVLNASGLAEAKAFYSGLFGWTWRDAGGLTLATLSGQEVAGARALGADEAEPPRWLAYVSVDNAAATAARAELLEGRIASPAAEVGALGRRAVIEDPAGARLGLWEAATLAGAREMGAPGTLAWFENNTPEVAVAEVFFEKMFGWESTRSESGARATLRLGGEPFANCLELDEASGAPPHWLVYFRVDDCLRAAAKAEDLLGCALVPPLETPAGRFAVIEDPQGAVFAIIQPRV